MASGDDTSTELRTAPGAAAGIVERARATSQALGLGGNWPWLASSVAVVALTGAWWEALRVALPEELLFRGVLFAEVQRRSRSTAYPAIASAMAFGLAHAALGAGWAGLLTIPPGLGFGYARAWSGSLWPAVALHAAANVLWV